MAHRFGVISRPRTAAVVVGGVLLAATGLGGGTSAAVVHSAVSTPLAGPTAGPPGSPPVGAPVAPVAPLGGVAPPAAPASKIDLSGWKLSIPVKSGKGTPTLLQPATPVAPWMVPDANGSLVFWAPSSGVTTENSSHPRTELDSLVNFTAGSSGRVHTLHATVAVHQEPADGKGIILGQIHGTDKISSVSFVMLRYQRGFVYVQVKQVQKGGATANYPLATGVALNTPFDFGISDMGNGRLVFSITRNGRIARVPAPVPAVFKGATVRFQAGSYQQADKPAGPQDGGKVTFHKLAELPVTTGSPVPAPAPVPVPTPAPTAPLPMMAAAPE